MRARCKEDLQSDWSTPVADGRIKHEPWCILGLPPRYSSRDMSSNGVWEARTNQSYLVQGTSRQATLLFQLLANKWVHVFREHIFIFIVLIIWKKSAVIPWFRIIGQFLDSLRSKQKKILTIWDSSYGLFDDPSVFLSAYNLFALPGFC
jgi:hypothetical protein